MRANELRVGNYINLNGKVVRIKSGKDIDKYSANTEVEPIQLTDEWIRKLGIEVGVLDGNMSINKSHICFFYCLYHNDEFTGTRSIKYVNTFQNLYFELTGEELEIKL